MKIKKPKTHFKHKQRNILLGVLLFIFFVGMPGLEFTVAAEEILIVPQADGNDMLDDTEAIQQALNEAGDIAELAIVEIPAGQYYINKTLIIRSNTTLRLSNETEIVRTNEQNIMLRSEQNPDVGGYGQVQNIIIEGGIWNGNVQDSTLLSSLMYFSHGENVVLRNFSIKNGCGKHMIILAGINNAHISNVHFSNFIPFTGVDSTNDYYTPNEQGEIDPDVSYRTMEALHLDPISSDGLSESHALPCDDTVNKNITVENCTFTDVMSGVGNHYNMNNDLMSSGLIIRNNTFTNVKYTAINIYNQGDFVAEGNTATNIGELLRLVNSFGTISSNNVSIREDAKDSSLGLCGIKATNASALNIINNTITGGGQGISLSSISGTLENNEISNAAANGITVLDNSNVHLTANTIHSSNENAIYVENSKATIVKNTLNSSNLNGLAVYDSSNIEIANNIVENAQNGFLLNATKANVSGNMLTNLAQNGIWSLNQSDVTLSENEISTSMNSGIRLEDTNGSISKNTIKISDKEGIYVYKAPAIAILENSLSEIKGNGIATYQSNNVQVDSNTITGSNNAILINTSQADVSKNIIESPNGKGIYLYESNNSASKKGSIIGNTIMNTKDRGIQLEGSTYVSIANNKIENSIQQGIRIILSSEHIEIKDNSVKHSAQHGIIVDNSKEVYITSNIVTGNKTREISILNASTGKAAHNIISNVGTYTYDQQKSPIISDTGMFKVLNEWGYLQNGVVDNTFTGMARNDYGWWYLNNGKLDLNYTGMAKNDYGWWYLRNGKLDLSYTGMARNDYGWWYMSSGKLDTVFTGIGLNPYGEWYIQNGSLRLNYSGILTLNGQIYRILNGKVM